MQITQRFQTTSKDTQESIFDSILSSRNISPQERDNFLSPPTPTLSNLIEVFSLDSGVLEGAKSLIDKHIDSGTDILIYGDYDADGITATAILYKTLVHLSKDSTSRILPFVPDRTRHGYGISTQSIEDIESGQAFANSKYTDFSPSLIITVDTGIVATKEVKAIKDLGIDIIITDHHQPEEGLPPADHIIHSLRSSGSAIAWIFALFLTDSEPSIYQLLDLATIGIVADQIKLTDINRTLVTHGLTKLRETNNPGVKKLMELASRELSALSAYDINYVLAPRINATGRLTNATTALRLLCSRDPDSISALATEINEINQERRELTQLGIDKALEIKPEHKIIIVSSPDYHEGVVGLIAGRLAEKWHRPALAISIRDDIAKGSARSIGEINITDLLREFQDDFLGIGGHKLAAGFSLKPGNLDDLVGKLYKYADQHIPDSALVPIFQVETELTLEQTSLNFAHLLARLAPFGRGNSQPRFTSSDLIVIEDKKLGAEGLHRRLTLMQDGLKREAIWFNCQEDYPIKNIQELIYTLNINSWRGRESLQLVVKHATI